MVHIDMIPGDKVEVSIAAKGGGSENKSKMVMLNPSDDVVESVSKPCRPWALAGARLACWGSASAVPPRRRPCSPRKP